MNTKAHLQVMSMALLGLFLSAGAIAADQTAAPKSWFGGPVYQGAPSLDVTAALVKAGGGAENFTFPAALVSMLGQKTVDSEVAKLKKQYGDEKVNQFIEGMTFAVKDGLKRATEAGVKLPAAPANLHGAALANTLVKAGTASDNVWWSGVLFDKALSNKIHMIVMADIEAKHDRAYDENIHRLLNQAMYDVAQALGHKDVKLASLH